MSSSLIVNPRFQFKVNVNDVGCWLEGHLYLILSPLRTTCTPSGGATPIFDSSRMGGNSIGLNKNPTSC